MNRLATITYYLGITLLLLAAVWTIFTLIVQDRLGDALLVCLFFGINGLVLGLLLTTVGNYIRINTKN